jgi:DMSO reductase iron-sulfur subunit
MTQYGFFIDLSRCTGCNACLIACKQWHDIPPGPVKWMRVYQWEKGSFPDIDLCVLPIMCFHCKNPVCAESCPNKAIYKEDKYGAVLVDTTKCKGERKCWEACPSGAPQFEGDDPGLKMSKCTMCIDRLEQGLKPICVLSCSLRALEFGPIEELNEKYGNYRHFDPSLNDYAPCRISCPAGVSPEDYIKLIAQGKSKEAIDSFRESTPFAGVLGRVCTHPCESDCRRGKFDDSISICSLKRFMGDDEIKKGREKAIPVQLNKKKEVAVIGSGPAGLSCAYDLVKKGYHVSVFEAASKSGGLLRYGIPAYRLPKDILDNEISYIQELGVEIKTNTQVKRLEDLTNQGYKAVFMANGAWQSQKMNIPGEDVAGIIYAMDFLRQLNSNMKVEIGNRVTVIGGGSVAIDAARSAIRLGATEVHLICLECRDFTSRDRILAQEWEVEEAEEEGVIIHPCLGISKFITVDGQITSLETIECISVYDNSGKFAPSFKENGTSALEADTVIIAIGQSVNRSVLSDKLKYNSDGTIAIDPITMQTSIKGVFAGGDAAGGPANIISAIATGKAAAISIERYLNRADLSLGRSPLSTTEILRSGFKSKRPPAIEAHKRKSFIEVHPGYDGETAIEQASRCMECGTTIPSVVIKSVDPKIQVVPWDSNRALELWQKRQPESDESLPDVFSNISDVTQPPSAIMFRNKLVLKAKDSQELMSRTMDDE